MIPMFLGSSPATPLHFGISHFQPQKRYSPDRARLPFDTRLGPKHFGGLGGEEEREERREQTCCLHSHVYC